MTSEFAIAVHALVYLNHRGEVVSSEVLAENVCTNPARIRKVMARLKRAGLIITKEGIEGGYRFCRPPEQVTLRQVADAVNSRLVASSWRSGGSCMDCLVATGMAGVMDGIYAELDELCKQRLDRMTLCDIDHKIFDAVPPKRKSIN